MQGNTFTLLPLNSSIPCPASRSTAYSAEVLLRMFVCSLLAASAGQGRQWISHHLHPSHRTGATSTLENEAAIQAAKNGILWLLHVLTGPVDTGACISTIGRCPAALHDLASYQPLPSMNSGWTIF